MGLRTTHHKRKRDRREKPGTKCRLEPDFFPGRRLVLSSLGAKSRFKLAGPRHLNVARGGEIDPPHETCQLSTCLGRTPKAADQSLRGRKLQWDRVVDMTTAIIWRTCVCDRDPSDEITLPQGAHEGVTNGT
jgi:hypothetical protein